MLCRSTCASGPTVNAGRERGRLLSGGLRVTRGLSPGDPWERWFRYDTGWRSVRPEATIELAHRGRRLSFLLEYEMRAIRPRMIAAKLRRYFGAADTGADFDGRRPAALFVFADEAAASRFCTLAARALENPPPLLVSDTQTITETRPLGRAWRSPLPRRPEGA